MQFARACFDFLARQVYAGIGTIICLHRVVPAVQGALLRANRNIEIAPEELDALLHHIRKQHYEIIPLDEVPQAICKPRRCKFIVFTFDDGYRDNLTQALPIFRAHNAPFTVNIVTGLISRSILAWWYLLDHLFACLDRIRYSDGLREQELPLRSLNEKNAAFTQLFNYIRGGDQKKCDSFVLGLFEGTGLDPVGISSGYFMDWEEVRSLAGDNLVTIGAHTVRHLALSRLDPNQLRSELFDARTTLEAEIKRPVRHMAFPYGDPETVGAREFEAARDCGFTTAVTTRSANIFRKHTSHLHSLPRIAIGSDGPAVDSFSFWESGLRPARKYRFRRVIA